MTTVAPKFPSYNVERLYKERPDTGNGDPLRVLDAMLIFPLFVSVMAADTPPPSTPPPPSNFWQRLPGWADVLKNLTFVEPVMNVTIHVPRDQHVELAVFLGSWLYESDDLAEVFPNVKIDMVSEQLEFLSTLNFLCC
jgi:hypothetical protein